MIDQGLLDRLTPQILKLLSDGREPITVYIDSRGGNPAYADAIFRLLKAPDQDGAPRCRIITVVTSRAASAAADMLSAGDYAIAFQGTTILYHGVRSALGVPVTAEHAAYLSESLRIDNDRFAMALAIKSHLRFAFRYVSLKSGFSAYRNKATGQGLSDFDCFLGLISEKLSPLGSRVMLKAKERNARYERVFESVLAKAAKRARFRNPKRQADMESAILHGIIDHLHRTNVGEDWNFSDGGLIQVNDEFVLLNEYGENFESHHLKGLCDLYGQFILTAADLNAIGNLPAGEQEAGRIEMVKLQIRPVWVFFVALCHALQEVEDWNLTATDAFWLGLIDEVIGVSDLPTLRIAVESQPSQMPHPGMLTLATPSN